MIEILIIVLSVATFIVASKSLKTRTEHGIADEWPMVNYLTSRFAPVLMILIALTPFAGFGGNRQSFVIVPFCIAILLVRVAEHDSLKKEAEKLNFTIDSAPKWAEASAFSSLDAKMQQDVLREVESIDQPRDSSSPSLDHFEQMLADGSSQTPLPSLEEWGPYDETATEG